MATVIERDADASSASQPGTTTFPAHRITVDRYERMVNAGIFGPDEPIFLWRGGLVEQMTRNDPHYFSVMALAHHLPRIVPEGWFTRQEGPVVVDGFSVPEPDFAVVRGSYLDYRTRKPTPGDVAILVEVSDSSLKIDSVDKLEVYAASRIPCYWIVNIPNRRIEVHTEPTALPASYRVRRIFSADDEVPVVIDGREVGRIAVRDILP